MSDFFLSVGGLIFVIDPIRLISAPAIEITLLIYAIISRGPYLRPFVNSAPMRYSPRSGPPLKSVPITSPNENILARTRLRKR